MFRFLSVAANVCPCLAGLVPCGRVSVSRRTSSPAFGRRERRVGNNHDALQLDDGPSLICLRLIIFNPSVSSIVAGAAPAEDGTVEQLPGVATRTHTVVVTPRRKHGEARTHRHAPTVHDAHSERHTATDSETQGQIDRESHSHKHRVPCTAHMGERRVHSHTRIRTRTDKHRPRQAHTSRDTCAHAHACAHMHTCTDTHRDIVTRVCTVHAHRHVQI